MTPDGDKKEGRVVSLDSSTFSTRAVSKVLREKESHLNFKRDLWRIMSVLNQYFICED